MKENVHAQAYHFKKAQKLQVQKHWTNLILTTWEEKQDSLSMK